jgi:uncharacterized protein DUF4157
MIARSNLLTRKALPNCSPFIPSNNLGARLQRKCACGGTPGPTGECEECRKNRESGTLRRAAGHPSFVPNSYEVPPVVHEVLRSPGQPLDSNTRSFFELRFGHDFSRVRLHTDAKAADSARMVNALAYTVGASRCNGRGSQRVRFDRGQKATCSRVDACDPAA